jgi:alkylation response protein AidB-like acyl-CoA dehydrogenase
MDFRLSPDTAAWRDDLRRFIAAELPPDLRGSDDFFDDADQVPAARVFYRKLGAKGWLAPAWPCEYGGMGRTQVEQLVLNEELAYHRVPHGGRLFTLGIVGPTMLIHGSPELKARFLPRMSSGEDWYCQGFSEPESGSDLASMQTTAVRDGDDYVVNGTKIWSSNAHHAEWMLLLARTDQDAPRHKGISAFIVDMKTPGISLAPIPNMAYRHDFNQTYFEDVRVPRENMLGGENMGWYVATTTLDFERSNIAAISGARRTLDDLICWARTPGAGGRRPWDTPGVRHLLADLRVECETGRLLAYRTVWLQSQGKVPNYEASIGKIWFAQLGIRVANAGINLLGLHGQLAPGSPAALLHGRLVTSYLLAVAGPIGGGTAEVQRGIIAARGLGLPRG